MDLHYGNGTAQLAALRPQIFALSLYGNDYWAQRMLSRRDRAPTRGRRKPPLLRRFPPAVTARRFSKSWTPRCRSSPSAAPTCCSIKPGPIPYFEDPYSPLALDHNDLLARDRRVFEFAKAHAIPVAWVLAGGYTSDVSKVVRVHLNTFRAWREIYGG